MVRAEETGSEGTGARRTSAIRLQRMGTAVDEIVGALRGPCTRATPTSPQQRGKFAAASRRLWMLASCPAGNPERSNGCLTRARVRRPAVSAPKPAAVPLGREPGTAIPVELAIEGLGPSVPEALPRAALVDGRAGPGPRRARRSVLRHPPGRRLPGRRAPPPRRGPPVGHACAGHDGAREGEPSNPGAGGGAPYRGGDASPAYTWGR